MRSKLLVLTLIVAACDGGPDVAAEQGVPGPAGASGAPGQQGTQGLQGPRGGGVTWTDAEGSVIPTIGVDLSSGSTRLWMADQDGVFFGVDAVSGMAVHAMAEASGFFDNASCTGAVYIEASRRPVPKFSVSVAVSMYSAPINYVVPASATPQTVDAYVKWGGMGPGTEMCSSSGPTSLLSITPVTLPSAPLFAGPATPAAT